LSNGTSNPSSPPGLGLAEVSTSSLERLREGLRSGTLRAPLTRASLIAFGVKGQLDALVSNLGGHAQSACVSAIDCVLAERIKHSRPTPELVWTGPEGTHAAARDTAVVLRALFESARTRVVLAGYSFREAESVLAPLHAVMLEHQVQAMFFVNVEQPSMPVDEVAYGQQQLQAFADGNWPFGPPFPEIYCDRRALRPGRGGEFCSLHAKCVAVDGERAFVSSANFTTRAQERNIEVGVLLHEAAFASQLERQWLSLIEANLVLGWND